MAADYPTTRTLYWRTDSTSGGNGTEDDNSGANPNRAFPTLDAVFAYVVATDADLTGDGPLFITCTTPGSVDTQATNTENGITTTAADYIQVECTGDAHHGGWSRDHTNGTGYQSNPSAFGVSNYLEYIRWKGIEFSNTSASNSPYHDYVTSSSSDIRFEQCLFTGSISNYLVEFAAGSQNITMTNCLVLQDGSGNGIHANNPGSIDITHCGVAGAGSLALVADGEATVYNTWAYGSSSEDFWTGGSAVQGDYNASEDTSVATDFTNYVSGFTASSEFTSPSTAPATADFTLLDSTLNAAGTDSFTSSVDITGAARTGTADIGPFNYASASSIIPQAMHHYRNNSGSGL